jgi:hypothetical protein
MDTVTIDGVEYVKANVLAKKLKYTSDYIGQLCRGKKVDAHLVGRTWYVYPPSLEGHKTTRYAELRSSDKTINNSIIKSSSRRDVISPIAKSTAKSQSPNFHNRVFWKNQSYQEDAADLLPMINKDAPPVTKMPITMADSERVRVSSVSKNVTMITQPMPAVVLAGTLKVQDFAPTFDSIGEFDETDNIVEKPRYVDKAEEVDASDDDTEVEARLAHDESQRTPSTTPKNLIPRNATYPVAIKKEVEDRLSSQRHLREQLAISHTQHRSKSMLGTQPVADREDKASSLFFRLVIAPAVILLTVAVASALLVLESVTSVKASGEQVGSWRFNSAAVSNFFTAE